MDGQSLRSIISSLIKESFLDEEDVVMRTSKYHGGKWNDTLKLVIMDLFKDVGGVKQIEASSPEGGGSKIRITLNNGDVIKAVTIPFPISGTVFITGRNGKLKKDINGPQAINLVSTMYNIWNEYSKGAGAERGKA
jgi:hypothetical protein